MGKFKNTNAKEEKIENQHEQNNFYNIEKNDSLDLKNLNSVQEQSEYPKIEENNQNEKLEAKKSQNIQTSQNDNSKN